MRPTGQLLVAGWCFAPALIGAFLMLPGGVVPTNGILLPTTPGWCVWAPFALPE
jgi:hypothetical protein